MKHFAALAATVLVFSMLLGVTALAAGFDDFPDGQGHWAEASLRRAVEEGLVNGEDGRLDPDGPATLSQLLTILSRMLEPVKTVSAQSVGLTGSNWYDEYVLSAASMGIGFDAERLERGELTRATAALVLADAFKLIPSEPDESPLSPFTDSVLLAGRRRDAMAALVAQKVVNGVTPTTLEPNLPLTRAELFTMLFRIVGKTAETAEPNGNAGLLVTGKGVLSGGTYEGPVWLGGSCRNIDLTDTRAGTVVVLSQVSGIKTGEDTQIEHLILAGGVGGQLELLGDIKTLTLYESTPRDVTVSGEVKNVELMEEGVKLIVTAPVEKLTVAGANSIVTVSGDANTVVLRGESNKLNLEGKVDSLTVGGRNNTVAGGEKCKAGAVTVASHTAKCDLPGEARERYDVLGEMELDFSVKKFVAVGEEAPAALTLSAPVEQKAEVDWMADGSTFKTESVTVGPTPVTLQAAAPANMSSATLTRAVAVRVRAGGGAVTMGEEMYTEGAEKALSAIQIAFAAGWNPALKEISANAQITNPFTAPVTAAMYIDGKLVDTKSITVGPSMVELNFSSAIEKPATRQYTAEVRLTSSYAGIGSYTSKTTAVDVKIGPTPQEALATVTCDYAGDFTLEWALNHDYTQEMKTVWVNAKGYSSQTKYLIWINRTYQRVNIFEGSQGSWTLIHEYLCGTGKPSTPTPLGEYTVWGYDKGWYHSYWCEPVVRFYTNSGYAFHSRLWNPGHQTLQDARIGFPISMGCVRMYDEDVQWMYNNIPIGTKVVVH